MILWFLYMSLDLDMSLNSTWIILYCIIIAQDTVMSLVEEFLNPRNDNSYDFEITKRTTIATSCERSRIKLVHVRQIENIIN